jgi:two-component system, NtrC family, response regulator GlrR
VGSRRRTDEKAATAGTPHDTSTLQHGDGGLRVDGATVRRFRIAVAAGAEPARAWESTLDTCSIGSHSLNDFVLADATVSRFHCEVKIERRGAVVRDLESRNGTILDGVRVESAFLRAGSVLQLGRVALRFELVAESNRLPVSDRTQLGGMASRSIAMRSSFALMERAATSEATVLLEGETGTGKTLAAEAIHQESARRDRLFLVVDCGALPPNLIESELFGHEKGAFTGATTRRIGVFEEAAGGTVFLDEIGELPLDLQPKLLRVLENREVRWGPRRCRTGWATSSTASSTRSPSPAARRRPSRAPRASRRAASRWPGCPAPT